MWRRKTKLSAKVIFSVSQTPYTSLSCGWLVAANFPFLERENKRRKDREREKGRGRDATEPFNSAEKPFTLCSSADYIYTQKLKNFCFIIKKIQHPEKKNLLVKKWLLSHKN